MGSSSKEKPTVTRALTVATRCPARHARKEVAQGSLSSLAVLPPRRGFGGAARDNSDYLVSGAARTPTAGKAAGPESGPCATRPDPDVRKAFRSRGTACRPLRVHCRRTRKGRASPTLPGDRVVQSGKLQAQRFQFERRLRFCDPEVVTVNPSLELTVDSSSKEKPTVARALTVAAARRGTQEKM